MTVLFPATPLPIYVASVFAVHPILIESVSWISGGFYVQYSFFLLLSLFLYILARGRVRRWYYLSIIAFFLSLTSSEKGIVFPLILCVWEISNQTTRKNWKKLVPYFSLSFIWGIILALQLGSHTKALETQYYLEASGLHNPLVQIPVAVGSYLQLFFLPLSLSLYHSEFILSGFSYLVYLSLFITYLGAIVYSFKKNKLVFFWLVFFILSLGVTLLPLKISWVIAERYVYLGTASLVVVFSMLLHYVFKKNKFRGRAFIIGIIVLLLAIRTIVRNNDWQDQDSLFLSLGKTAPSDPKTHNNLGDVYARRGDLNRAVEEFKQAIVLNPRYADAYHNLANTYQQIGKLDLALANYQKAVEINPRLWQSYQNMAAIYADKKKYEQAINYMSRASSINPGNIGLKTNVGIIYLMMGKKDQAREIFLTVLRVDPQNQKARAGLIEVEK